MKIRYQMIVKSFTAKVSDSGMQEVLILEEMS